MHAPHNSPPAQTTPLPASTNAVSIEVCVDSVAGLATCQGHADRIELCSALSLGGLTPTPGLIARATDSVVPVYAMIRPEAGGFDLLPDQVDLMCCEIRSIRAAGLAGVVIGATQHDTQGQCHVDRSALARMCDAAGPLDITLHRAIDLTCDPLAALEVAIELGIGRILSSGGAVRATDGAARLAAMQRHAAGQITLMAGGGVAPDTLPALAAATGITAFHASCSRATPTARDLYAMGFAPQTQARTDAGMIDALRAAAITACRPTRAPV
ncbi:MAG: copper homeostasis protein CutC [Paracoccaceae bacterium]